jgi:hypothetical protein
MILRIYDIDALRTQYVDELGNFFDDIGDAEFTDVPTPSEALDMVRTERNARLAASDWTQLADVPLASSEVTQWRIYRQELRDMMRGFAWNASTWPRKP